MDSNDREKPEIFRLRLENSHLKATIERVGRVWALWVIEGYGVNGNPIDDIGDALAMSSAQKTCLLDEAETAHNENRDQ